MLAIVNGMVSSSKIKSYERCDVWEKMLNRNLHTAFLTFLAAALSSAVFVELFLFFCKVSGFKVLQRNVSILLLYYKQPSFAKRKVRVPLL